MSKVERFDCTNGGALFCNGCYFMDERDDGDYVRYEDYAALERRLESAERVVDVLNSAPIERRCKMASEFAEQHRREFPKESE